MVTDQQLSDLFAEGTAPERDHAFALQVAAAVGRTRLRRRLLALGLRVTVPLILSVPIFVASRLIAPVLAHLVEGVPQFMGVPVPIVVLGVLVVGLVQRVRLQVLFRLFAPSSS